MFAPRYFLLRFFAGRYFPVGFTSSAPDRPFVIISPIVIRESFASLVIATVVPLSPIVHVVRLEKS